MAAEGRPDPGDDLVDGLRVGEVLAGGQQAPQQQRPRRAAPVLGGNREMGGADGAQLAVVEPETAHLRADEPDHLTAVDRDQRRQLRVGPGDVEQGRGEEAGDLVVGHPVGKGLPQQDRDDGQVGMFEGADLWHRTPGS